MSKIASNFPSLTFRELIDSAIIGCSVDTTKPKPYCSLSIHMSCFEDSIDECREQMKQSITQLTNDQINDIVEIITHFSKQSCILNIRYIHVINSFSNSETEGAQTPYEPIHYCQIINKDFLVNSSADTERESDSDNEMYILYKPTVWERAREQQKRSKNISFWRKLLSIFPITLKWSCRTVHNVTSWELSTTNNRNRFDIFIDFLTTVNCFAYVYLSKFRNVTTEGNSFITVLVNDPLRLCSSIILRGIGYSLCGVTLSNLLPLTTNVLFNSILGYAVYLLYNNKY